MSSVVWSAPSPEDIIRRLAGMSWAAFVGSLGTVVGLLLALGYQSAAIGAALLLPLMMTLHFASKSPDRAGLLLVIWLLIEDGFRKYLGLVLVPVALKYVLVLVLLLSLFNTPSHRGSWTRIPRRARLALLVLVLVQLLLSPLGARFGALLPVLGLLQNFGMIPLLWLGIYLVDTGRAQRAIGVTLALATVALIPGIIQALVSQDLFNPATSEEFAHLYLQRSVAGEFRIGRPSGLFVDPWRYTSLAVVQLGTAASAVFLWRKANRGLPILAVAIGVLATFLTGARAGLFILTGGLAIFAYRQFRESGATFVAMVVSVAILIGGAVGFAATTGGSVEAVEDVESRANYYLAGLQGEQGREFREHRSAVYIGGIVQGLEEGGLLGLGTGTESRGQQYLGGTRQSPTQGLNIEGGYASVAVETGLIGLAVWLLWLLWWLVDLFPSKALIHSRYYSGMLQLWSMLFLLLVGWFGATYSVVQNHITSGFIWFASGILIAARRRAANGEQL